MKQGYQIVAIWKFCRCQCTFLYGDTSRFCTSSTCDIQLRLPTCYGEDYQAFKDAMIMSLKDNDGFGGV